MLICLHTNEIWLTAKFLASGHAVACIVCADSNLLEANTKGHLAC